MHSAIRWAAAAVFAGVALCHTQVGAAAPPGAVPGPTPIAKPADESVAQSNPPAGAPGAPKAATSQPTTFGAKGDDLSLTPAAPSAAGTETLGKVLVTATAQPFAAVVAPSIGASAYTIGPAQIETVPGGESATFQQVLLRAPGVVPDSFGQEHVRGEHGNLTYRVNGVLLPEPLNGFGQELDTRLVKSVTLIDGTLPAQFGFHTAGIVDVTTKSGSTMQGGELSLYGGSYDTFNPSVQVGGTDGKLDYFVTGSFLHNDLGIENPTPSHRPLHDYTNQERAFGYFSYHIDDTSRLSVLLNGYDGDFQIPNTRSLPPAFTLANHPTADSGAVNENQNEQEDYLVVSYQKTIDKLTLQASVFSRYGQITFNPDPVADLVFQGVAGKVRNGFLTNGLEFDSAYVLNDQHTIRAGFLTDYTQETLDTNTSVFNLNSGGMQISNFARSISDDSSNQAWQSGIYVQDEWSITPKLTVNYGLRYDRFDANFDTEDQVSPRVNVVYKVDDATTAHAGYARYFVPPPVQNVSTSILKRFVNTSNASENLLADPPRVERSNYYDTGISHQITRDWQVGVDGFYKQAKNLIDLGQFGQAVILSPYNYTEGRVFGSELSTTYHHDGFSAYGNFSWVRTMAHDIDSQQFEFGNDELAYIKTHNIKLDHESEYTIAAGASYAWPHDRVSVDFLYGSGLRAGFANTQKEPNYYPISIGYEHTFPLHGGGKSLKFRFDIINVLDENYQIRNGSGLGVGAPQYGQRRSFLAGITYAF